MSKFSHFGVISYVGNRLLPIFLPIIVKDCKGARCLFLLKMRIFMCVFIHTFVPIFVHIYTHKNVCVNDTQKFVKVGWKDVNS